MLTNGRNSNLSSVSHTDFILHAATFTSQFILTDVTKIFLHAFLHTQIVILTKAMGPLHRPVARSDGDATSCSSLINPAAFNSGLFRWNTVEDTVIAGL